jgi:protein phosphatase
MTTQATVLAAMATDVGRVRDHNEDMGLVTPLVFVVADGMGGHAAGEVASRIAVDSMRPLAEKVGLGPADVVGGIVEANRAILESAASHPEQAGMATTLAALAQVTHDGSPRWAVVNVGDSRVYWFAGGELTQVSEDHSEVAELVSLGLLSPEDALRHPARNIVTRCLGRDPLDPVDTWVLEPEAGERFLLCTDGLTNELSDADIAKLLAEGDDPQTIADTLVAAAVAAGGRDNVTVVVVLGNRDDG